MPARNLPATILLAAVLLAGATAGCGERAGVGAGEGAARPLRHQPRGDLSTASAAETLRRLGLFDAHLNPDGRGNAGRYRLTDDGAVVIDQTTGLHWQREGSSGRLTFDRAEAYVAELGREALGGFDDWRLPALEEALSINRREPGAGGLHLDLLFGDRAWWIWTADRESLVGIWVVDFAGGSAFVHVPVGGSAHVRAVRGGASAAAESAP